MYLNYRDPVHNLIRFHKKDEKLFIDLFNTKEIQRLRRIKQLGLSYFTYAGAEHSRFTHSIGVAHLMKRIIHQLWLLSEKEPFREYIRNIKDYEDLSICSAILHDVGHGPFSHAIEKYTKKKHETWSREIISDNRTEVHQVLACHNSDLPNQADEVLNRIFSEKFVVKMLSSQLDADRIDYLLRDSISTGTNYGKFDLEWLLQAIRVGELKNGDIEIGVDLKKGQGVVEAFVLARRAMYLQVYYHKTTRGAEVLVSKIFKRATELIKSSFDIYVLDEVKKLLLGERLTIDEYLSLDDSVVLFHFNRWSKCKDSILCDLSSRFLNRQLFKSTDLNMDKYDFDEFMDRFSKIKELLEKTGFDSNYYLAQDKAKHSTYQDYYLFSQKAKNDEEASEDIYLFGEAGEYEELSNVSDLIRSIKNTTKLIDRVYYPAEIREDIQDILSNR